MSLKEYQRKRHFEDTPEPAGKTAKAEGRLFVIQKHAASHLHYDFRLELEGVLKSWAVPKGPSLNPANKRLAVQVEDHPVEYGDFEGIIPTGNYGAGTVMVWDHGEWAPTEDPHLGLRNGRLKFTLNGDKLRGGWMLVRKGGAASKDERNWFLIKERDVEAATGKEIVDIKPDSVVSQLTMDEIAAQKKRVWKSNRSASSKSESPKTQQAKRQSARKQTPRSASKRELSGGDDGTKRRMPTKIVPQLATLVDEPPDGSDWLHEIKFDGYRMICRIEDGNVRFISRNQQDWSSKLEPLIDDARLLKVKSAIIDGEVAVLDKQGVSRFQLLQNAFHDQQSVSFHYYVFDLLYLDGRDLSHVPLQRRKEILAQLLSASGDVTRIAFSDHVLGEGSAFFEQAKKQKLEGIISKRRDGTYRPGRSHEWLKTKCVARAEFVVGGYTDPSGSRKSLGALLVGYHDAAGKLLYAGKVGTGLSARELASLRRHLQSLARSKSPFSDFPIGRAGSKTHWVEPTLVAEVEFSNWTDGGHLRHASFIGLREDKPAASVVREAAQSLSRLQRETRRATATPLDGRSADLPKNSRRRTKSMAAAAETGLTSQIHDRKSATDRAGSAVTHRSPRERLSQTGIELTHPDKVLYPEERLTKLDLAQYYASVAEWILPHIHDRLAVVVRCPDGAAKECFYQKHPGQGTPDFLRQIAVKEKNSSGNYLVIENLRGLIWLAQAGVLEIHVWGSRIDDIERPDRLVFDLDPDPDLAWPHVVESAIQFREFLRALGLESLLKTTGGKGLHLVVPVQRRSSWDEAKDFCHAVALAVEAADPDRYIAKMTKSARQGKIFVDYLRNQRGATSVAPYSSRARQGAPVSVPITWDELQQQHVRSDEFTIQNLSARLNSLKKDPWAELSSIRQSITATARKMLSR